MELSVLLADLFSLDPWDNIQSNNTIDPYTKMNDHAQKQFALERTKSGGS